MRKINLFTKTFSDFAKKMQDRRKIRRFGKNFKRDNVLKSIVKVFFFLFDTKKKLLQRRRMLEQILNSTI